MGAQSWTCFVRGCWQGQPDPITENAPEPFLHWRRQAEKKGVRNDVSANLVRLRTDPSKFGRWGHNSAYHIGELSHAVLGDAFRPGPHRSSYGRWRDALFASTVPPVLKGPVFIHLVPWHGEAHGPSGLVGSVAAAEYELIALAAAAHPAELLNIQGR